jgi:transcriptional regulator with XRE-family HTH domain
MTTAACPLPTARRTIPGNEPAMPGNDADSTLRAIRHRRGLTLAAVAERAGFTAAHLSMLETGKRKLRRLDHITALAAVLRVPPSELIDEEILSDGEWATRGGLPDRGVPGNCDDIATGRHARLADELTGHISRGDGYAAGELLKRMTRDRSVNPWLLLDQLTKRQARILRPMPPTAPARRQITDASEADTRHQRGRRGALWLFACFYEPFLALRGFVTLIYPRPRRQQET